MGRSAHLLLDPATPTSPDDPAADAQAQRHRGLGDDAENRLGSMLATGAVTKPGLKQLTVMRFAIFLAATLLIAPGAIAQTCKTFSSCDEAVRSYRSGNSKLDRDKDGVPCESLCGKNGERMR